MCYDAKANIGIQGFIHIAPLNRLDVFNVRAV